MNRFNIDLEEFLSTGFQLKSHLAQYLGITDEELEKTLLSGLDKMASMHPGSLNNDELTGFYEFKVGTAHLFDLAAWHLGSSDYIADTLRLQSMFATGQVLDFGGGIGTHSIAAAASSSVEHVFFVDLNPHNRNFVKQRANQLGLSDRLSVHRDIESTGKVKFDTVICLDVLEHLADPSHQLLCFLDRLSADSVALMNWYFFKGHNGEYPFHIDDEAVVNQFFLTLQSNFLEIFHPFLITTRAYKPMRPN